MISLRTFSSIFSPLSMYLTATSSLVFLSLTNFATPKFPEPSSLIGSYLSSIKPTQQLNHQLWKENGREQKQGSPK
uniref:Uncharacterized protein MANES_17G021500 n=1 Tax=Rhizophora mucronata TaxID=61149 RepID=A0A2P2KKQ8_RHIMU